MRICLLSLTYPPTSTEGIARQRQALAEELAGRGHDVHVVTCGDDNRTYEERGVWVHTARVGRAIAYLPSYPRLDMPLTQSQALYNGLLRLESIAPFDVIDVPLWAAQGFVTLQHHRGASVVWLQTTTAQWMSLTGQRALIAANPMIELERQCLERADGLLSDSQVALDSVLHDYQIKPSFPAGIAHLGLPPLREPTVRVASTTVTAIIVGRLEQRKGTHLLFELLPNLLRRHPQLNIRFIGSDNSRYDGWHARHGCTYAEFFQRRHPELSPQVVFEGYVSEPLLDQYYRQADILLAPSLYESFGLMYLEAMRAALPVVTFARGGAVEIFARGDNDGAVLVPIGNTRAFSTAITLLVEQPALRRVLGERGLTRFEAAFSASAMADATLAYYEQVTAHGTTAQTQPGPVYQVMEALDIGDAVSNIARRNRAFLVELGQPAAILARYSQRDVQDETRPVSEALATPECNLLFHYWNYNTSAWVVSAVRGRKAIHYHNITPPEYFSPGSQDYNFTIRGYTQLHQIANHFDLVIGDSRFNTHEFSRFLTRPMPSLVLYPIVEADEVQAGSYDGALVDRLGQQGDVQIVFVGRVVRNKRQDQLMLLFDQYYRDVNRHAQLWLVGNDQVDSVYRAELDQLRSTLVSSERINFTGKVSESEMHAYFRAADVFVCASEHEGFCVPIAQAMAFDVPVLAYAATAVPETMGGAGVLVDTWDTVRLAELLHLLATDTHLRARVLAGQRIALQRFSSAEARVRLAAAVTFLQTGEAHPFFETLVPTATMHVENMLARA